MWMKTAIGLNEAIYSNPTEFNPERYEEERGHKKENIESSMPFGGGIRHCVGSHLAESLCTRLLSMIIKEFELVAVSEANVSYNALISVTPSVVPVMLKPRSKVAVPVST